MIGSCSTASDSKAKFDYHFGCYHLRSVHIMKNKFHLVVSVILVTVAGLGCGFIQSGSEPAPNSNKSLTDKAVDKTVGKSNIGIPECDQLIDAIDSELNNPDDNFVTKAAKATVLNQIKDSIRQSIEENKNDKTEVAKACKEFKVQFEKFKSDSADNSKQ